MEHNGKLEEVTSILQRMQKALACAVCLDLLNNPVTTKCGHSFCKNCISQLVKGPCRTTACPLCLSEITRRSLYKNAKILDYIKAVKNIIGSIKNDCGIQLSPAKYFPRPGLLHKPGDDDSENEENDEPRRGKRKRGNTMMFSPVEPLPKTHQTRSKSSRNIISTDSNSLDIFSYVETENKAASKGDSELDDDSVRSEKCMSATKKLFDGQGLKLDDKLVNSNYFVHCEELYSKSDLNLQLLQGISHIAKDSNYHKCEKFKSIPKSGQKVQCRVTYPKSKDKELGASVSQIQTEIVFPDEQVGTTTSSSSNLDINLDRETPLLKVAKWLDQSCHTGFQIGSYYESGNKDSDKIETSIRSPDIIGPSFPNAIPALSDNENINSGPTVNTSKTVGNHVTPLNKNDMFELIPSQKSTDRPPCNSRRGRKARVGCHSNSHSHVLHNSVNWKLHTTSPDRGSYELKKLVSIATKETSGKSAESDTENVKNTLFNEDTMSWQKPAHIDNHVMGFNSGSESSEEKDKCNVSDAKGDDIHNICSVQTNDEFDMAVDQLGHINEPHICTEVVASQKSGFDDVFMTPDIPPDLKYDKGTKGFSASNNTKQRRDPILYSKMGKEVLVSLAECGDKNCAPLGDSSTKLMPRKRRKINNPPPPPAIESMSEGEIKREKLRKGREQEAKLRSFIVKDDATVNTGSHISETRMTMPPPKCPVTRSKQVYFDPMQKDEPLRRELKCKSSNLRYASQLKSRFLCSLKPGLMLSPKISDRKSPGWSRQSKAKEELGNRHPMLNITGGGESTVQHKGSVTHSALSMLQSSSESDFITEEDSQEPGIDHLDLSQSKVCKLDTLNRIVSDLKESSLLEQESAEFKLKNFSQKMNSSFEKAGTDIISIEQKVTSDLKDHGELSKVDVNSKNPNVEALSSVKKVVIVASDDADNSAGCIVNKEPTISNSCLTTKRCVPFVLKGHFETNNEYQNCYFFEQDHAKSFSCCSCEPNFCKCPGVDSHRVGFRQYSHSIPCEIFQSFLKCMTYVLSQASRCHNTECNLPIEDVDKAVSLAECKSVGREKDNNSYKLHGSLVKSHIGNADFKRPKENSSTLSGSVLKCDELKNVYDNVDADTSFPVDVETEPLFNNFESDTILESSVSEGTMVMALPLPVSSCLKTRLELASQVSMSEINSNVNVLLLSSESLKNAADGKSKDANLMESNVPIVEDASAVCEELTKDGNTTCSTSNKNPLKGDASLNLDIEKENYPGVANHATSVQPQLKFQPGFGDSKLSNISNEIIDEYVDLPRLTSVISRSKSKLSHDKILSNSINKSTRIETDKDSSPLRSGRYRYKRIRCPSPSESSSDEETTVKFPNSGKNTEELNDIKQPHKTRSELDEEVIRDLGRINENIMKNFNCSFVCDNNDDSVASRAHLKISAEDNSQTFMSQNSVVSETNKILENIDHDLELIRKKRQAKEFTDLHGGSLDDDDDDAFANVSSQEAVTDVHKSTELEHAETEDTDSHSYSSAISESGIISTQKKKKMEREVDMLKSKIKYLEAQLKPTLPCIESESREEDRVLSSKMNDCEAFCGAESQELFSSVPSTVVDTVPVAPCQRSNENTVSVILCTGLTSVETDLVQKLVRELLPHGRFECSWVPGVTHIIAKTGPDNQVDRTLKYLYGVATGCWIVSLLWVRESLHASKILPEEGYEVIDCSGELGPKRGRTLVNPLFEGLMIWPVPPFSDITQVQVKELVHMCGGKAISSHSEFHADSESTKIIIVEIEDTALIAGLQKSHKKPIVSCDWLIECVGMYRLVSILDYLVGEYTMEDLRAMNIRSDLLYCSQDKQNKI